MNEEIEKETESVSTMKELGKVIYSTINTIKQIVGRRKREERKRKRTKQERNLLQLQKAVEQQNITKIQKMGIKGRNKKQLIKSIRKD